MSKKTVVVGLSGGVDFSVVAALLHRAIGNQLTCVFVDNGLLRLNEGEQVKQTFARNLGVKVIHVDATEQFMGHLQGVADPEAKRKIIGREFVEVFQAEAAKLPKARKETRYQKLMNKVIKEGVKTKVLMLSATPVNNRFADLHNQLALAYEGDPENLTKKLRTDRSVEEIFRGAQAAFNAWSKLPPVERTARAILDSLDFDFFELLDSVTIARSRKHIQTFYDTKDIGQFPERRKPLSFHCPLTERSDVLGFNEIFEQLSLLKLAVYAPICYILPIRLKKYEEIYDTKVGGKGTLRQADREKSLQALMTVNLLKRLESSVQSFRLTLQSLRANNEATLAKIAAFNQSGGAVTVGDLAEVLEGLEW